MTEVYSVAGGTMFGDLFGASPDAVMRRLYQHMKDGKLRRQLEQAGQNI